MKGFFLLTVVLLLSGISADTLIWSDEFNTFNLDTWQVMFPFLFLFLFSFEFFFFFSKIKHEITAGGGGNWEFEYYYNNRSNSYVRDGILHIRPTLTSDRLGEANMYSGGSLDLWFEWIFRWPFFLLSLFLSLFFTPLLYFLLELGGLNQLISAQEMPFMDVNAMQVEEETS